jgi:GNAT superfamily N-acetyltransferase
MNLTTMDATEEGLLRLKALFDDNNSPKNLNDLRWRYLHNPVESTFVDFAIDDESGATAGVYCASPCRFKVGEGERIAVQSLDTLTDTDFRGRGLFKMLAKRTYDRCSEAGVVAVYGFPNGNSAFGFFERLGWTRLDPLPFLIRPLRLPYLGQKLGLPAAWTERLPPRPLVSLRPPALSADAELRVVLEFDDTFDELWQLFAPSFQVGLVRDAAYLRWRFDQKPSKRYKTYGLYRGGRLTSFVTFTVAEKHGGRVGYVMELMHDPARTEDGRLLLRQALADMARSGADAVLAWNLAHSVNRPAFRGTGFLPFPERARPVELHFGIRVFGEFPALASPGDSPALGNRRNWYLSYCDSDTV